MDEFRIEGVKQDGDKPLIVTSNIVDSSGVLLDIIFETNPIDKVTFVTFPLFDH